MVDAGTVTVSVIAQPNPLPESEMDALLLGRTKVSLPFCLFCERLLAILA